MRRRLLLSLSLFAAIAVCGFAIPLALTLADNRTQEFFASRTGDAQRFASLAAGEGDHGELAQEVGRFFDLYGEGVLIVGVDGAPVQVAGVTAADDNVQAAVAAARQNLPSAPAGRLMPWSADRLMIATPVGTGTQVEGAVVIVASTADTRHDIALGWLAVAAGAVVALALFAGLALGLARWVLRPLAGLSTVVGDLTARLPRPRTTASVLPQSARSGPPEVRDLAVSFDTLAATVVDSIDAQRQLIADTAHAMRNPLAALSIRLDTLEPALSAPGHVTLQGATAEVSRLTALLDGLLELATAEAADATALATPEDLDEQSCDVAQVVADRLDAWHPTFVDAAMTLRTGALPPATEAAIPGDTLAQILDVLLSNAARYAGRGAETVIDVRVGASEVMLTVTDDGVGVAADEIDRLTTRFFRAHSSAGAGGSGLGLPIAAALAQARHGRLDVAHRDPTGLVVTVTMARGAR